MANKKVVGDILGLDEDQQNLYFHIEILVELDKDTLIGKDIGSYAVDTRIGEIMVNDDMEGQTSFFNWVVMKISRLKNKINNLTTG